MCHGLLMINEATCISHYIANSVPIDFMYVSTTLISIIFGESVCLSVTLCVRVCESVFVRVWESVFVRVWESVCVRVWESVCVRVWESVCVCVFSP